jgi:hypothetical protein
MHAPLKPLKMAIATSACARIETWQFNIEESPSRVCTPTSRARPRLHTLRSAPDNHFFSRGKGKDDAAPNLQWHGKNHSINWLLLDAIGAPPQGGML